MSKKFDPKINVKGNIKKWFSKLEKTLNNELESVNIIGHKLSKGDLRELFVKRILERFLPWGISVGSGEIYSSHSQKKSRQVDIIIFDNRFPKFAISGEAKNAIYPIEGVIATIEVKSILNSKSLSQALENCYSVNTLGLELYESISGEVVSRIAKKEGIERVFASHKIFWRLSPRTYIFGFKGYSSQAKNLCNSVFNWVKEKEKIGTTYATALPRIIVAEGVIGLSRDEKIIPKEMDFIAFPFEERFGLLVSHLLSVIADRFLPKYEHLGIPYNLQRYFPLDLYKLDIEEVKDSGEKAFGFKFDEDFVIRDDFL